jgi:hypothetical protein
MKFQFLTPNNAWEKKASPCARLGKESICAPWQPARGNVCVSCAKIRNKVRKGPNSEYHLRQDILRIEGLHDFFHMKKPEANLVPSHQLRQDFQCKFLFKWKVTRNLICDSNLYMYGLN